MGYHIYQESCNFFIQGTSVIDAFHAVKALADAEDKGRNGTHYAWVDTDTLRNATTLKEAMSEWGWEISFNETGDVDDIYFNGEKLGDDAILFAAIAPFVKAGSYIEMRGEDDCFWKWKFNGSYMYEVNGVMIVTYGDEKR
jgi:hypothetical protein